jgi:NDP-sugar pyrophosphorylase family protein
MKETVGLIFSAGKGTRLAPLTNKTPKVLLPVKGSETLLDYNIKGMISVGIKNIIINYSYAEGLFKECINKYKKEIDIHLYYENEPLGHGKTLLNNYEYLSNFKYVFCSNGDTIVNYDYSFFSNTIYKNHIEAILLSDKRFTAIPNNVITDISNRVVGYKSTKGDFFYKGKPFLKKRYNFLGEYIIKREALKGMNNEDDFIGIWGEDDIFERIVKNSGTIKIQNQNTNFMLTMNTMEEYNELKIKINQI